VEALGRVRFLVAPHLITQQRMGGIPRVEEFVFLHRSGVAWL
jgi:hypothetical protein